MSRRFAGREPRGQLIIVAALLLAVVFVGLALIVNSAIFAENLATRDTGDSEEAKAFTLDASGAVMEAYTLANGADANTTSEARATFNATFDAWAGAAKERAAKRGVATEIERTPHLGWRLEQRSDRPFTPANDTDATEWQVASDTENVSTAQVNVTRDSLYDAALDFDNTSDDAFRFRVDNGTHDWRVYVFRDSTNSTMVVHVGDPGDFGTLDALLDVESTCTRTASRAVIDFRNATFDGTDCAPLAFGGNLTGPVDIHYENVREGVGGTPRVEGQYTLVVNGSKTVATDGSGYPDQFNNTTDAAPTAQGIVYAASYATEYEGDDVAHDRSGRLLVRAEAYAG